MKSTVIVNKYVGTCTECAQRVEVGDGIAHKSPVSGKWLVRHRPERRIDPTGPWDKFESYTVGGCPRG